MNLPANEFWEKAKTNFLLKELIVESEIEKEPVFGIGSKGGGRIMVCEFCGFVKWVDNTTQNFCSYKCRYEYADGDKVPRLDPRRSNIPKTERKYRYNMERDCGFCGKRFKVRMSKIKKGEGVYCSASCASQARGLMPLWYECYVCGTKFRAIGETSSLYCCMECMSAKPFTKADGSYNHPVHKLVDPDDLIDHYVNIILLSMKKRYPDIKLSPRLRMEVLHKHKVGKRPDLYYLNDFERSQIQRIKDQLEQKS